MRKQRLAYATHGPIAQSIANGTWEQDKVTFGFGDHTPASKTGAVNSTHDPCWRTREDKQKEGIPSGGSSKYGVKPQVRQFLPLHAFFVISCGVLAAITAKRCIYMLIGSLRSGQVTGLSQNTGLN